MKFIADIHLHSKYSAATSSQADLPHLHLWALIKGIDLVATSDFTHPGWMAELKDQLEPDGTGLFRLKEKFLKSLSPGIGDWPLADRPVRFILSSEISSIYKKVGKTRKIHNLALFDSFEAAERYTKKLAKLGNIAYDGRPILGVDSRDVMSISLDSGGAGSMFIPAHIWTPWFSLFGSRSGFDAIEECFEDLTPEVTALETGLSSDPPMNWMISSLDRFNLVSNSDAHSPQNLGREANLFDTDLSFAAIRSALRDKASAGFAGTLEFFPEEGKYHNDGHRDCGINFTPGESLKNSNNCPVCGKPLTIGVLHRVLELADRKYGERPPNAKNFESLVPLKSILAESYGSLSVKKTDEAYRRLVLALGPEFSILRTVPVAEIERASNAVVAEGIRRVREGRVDRVPGYDGEFGTISLFSAEERDRLMDQDRLFEIVAPRKARKSDRDRISGIPVKTSVKTRKRVMDARQEEIVRNAAWPVAVAAGPGTGKTFVLSEKIRSLPEGTKACAITFTRRAADELGRRLGSFAGWAGTIHALCLRLLRMTTPDLQVLAPREAELVLSAELGIADPAAALETIGRIKSLPPGNRPQDPVLTRYKTWLSENRFVDFDDIVTDAAGLIASDPAVRDRVRVEFNCVFVDEFQDVNEAQYAFVLELAGLLGNRLFVIGDPDQSIYGFRGAVADVFVRLSESLPGICRFGLERNFRSTEAIVSASRRLFGRTPRSAGKKAAGIFRVTAESGLVEAVFIAKTISKKLGGRDMIESRKHASGTRSLNDFGVLVRTGRQARVIADCLAKEGLAFRTRDGAGFLGRPEAAACVNLAKLVLHPEDRMARLFFSGKDFPFDDLFSKFTERKDRYAENAAGLVDDLSKVVDFRDEAALDELLSVAAENPRLEDFLDLLLYRDPSEVVTGRRTVPAEAVSVLTMHAAKGLEFPVVFLAGLKEGIVPWHSAPEIPESELEAERRLFYVAMTRAAEELYLICDATRPSRFAEDAGLGMSESLAAMKRKRPDLQPELFERTK